MASLSERARELGLRIVDQPSDVRWLTGDDLSRMSIEAMGGRDELGRQQISTGLIRLAGEGVENSSALMDSIGDVLTRFQKLITATGASIRGHRKIRGPYPSDVVLHTQLRLLASPFAGSVVLEFMPNTPPASELTPDGNVPLVDETTDQLADLSVMDAFAIMDSAKEIGVGVDNSVFLERVSERGARVATALRELADVFDAGGFDTELTWRQPNRPSVRASLSRVDAHRIVSIVTTRELDAEPAMLEGYLRTISDLTKLVIETASGDLLKFDGASLSPEILSRATLHSHVRVHVLVKIEQQLGGDEVLRYNAFQMEILDT